MVNPTRLLDAAEAYYDAQNTGSEHATVLAGVQLRLAAIGYAHDVAEGRRLRLSPVPGLGSGFYEAVVPAGSEPEDERGEDYDPSPMCNCGTCADGNYTCVRHD